jgi:hypothetical protein
MLNILQKIYYIKINYNKYILVGIISNPYTIHGISIINATTIGNRTVHEKDIN